LIQIEPEQQAALALSLQSSDRTMLAPPGPPQPFGQGAMPPVVMPPTSGQAAPAPPPMLSVAPMPGGGAPPPPAMAAPAFATPSPGHTMIAPPREPGDDDRTVPAPGRGTPEDAATQRRHAPPPAADDNAPTTSFDPRQVAAAVAAMPARAPGEDTREGVTPHGPWAGSSPSSPVVGARGQASLPTHPGTTSARLVLVARDGTEGDKFAVVGDRLTLGRRAADVLFPEDDFLSPTHARIERQGDNFWLIDSGSQNGVFLRVRGTAPIYPGDSFMIGHQLLRVENLEGPTDEQPPDELGTRLFGTPLQPAWGKIVVLGRGGIRGDQFGLRGARVVLGRESGDVLFPHDPFLSREHARLRLELNGATMSVFIEDLNSANGTYIRIRGAAELHNRDTFRIGDQIIRLRLD
jgi:pSer/pThr/pTyr-binding forkhead associated (FHA) protein